MLVTRLLATAVDSCMVDYFCSTNFEQVFNVVYGQ